jgi:hypothetical protein
MPKVLQVTLWDVKEKLPESNTMIIADDGEWHILMYEGENTGYGWEDDQLVTFSQWAYLDDLNSAQQGVQATGVDATHTCPIHPIVFDVDGCFMCNPRAERKPLGGLLENEMDEGLKIWQEWFEWSGEPWVDDDYGNTDCFFCGEGKPNHMLSCAFVKAQALCLPNANR